MNKPMGYETDLGSFGVLLYDSCCGEPIAWGFKILHQLGEDRFNALKNYGRVECLNHLHHEWGLITKTLSRKEAIAQYGSITNEKFGPRGGWKSVTFGKITFISREMASTNVH